jgi:phage terminase large subunit-like protein
MKGAQADADLREILRTMPTETLAPLLHANGISAADMDHIWAARARDAQWPPNGDWRVWLIMAGRGFGKTRSGAEWVRQKALRNPHCRIALVGATLDDARAIMVEGASGLLSISPKVEGVLWVPSLRRLCWPNGAQARIFSASDPDSLRGPEHHFAWGDEIAKWPDGNTAWDTMMLGLRQGRLPQVLATTTPRPVPLIRRLMAEDGVVRTFGRTQDNANHLPAAFITAMEAHYTNTRFGRQELDGQLIEDVEGALWSRQMIEGCRVVAPPTMKRIVIGVDPPASVGGDACGIVVVGLGDDGRAYVLADASVSGCSPEGWARAVAVAAQAWRADRVIAESNNGGNMVESTLRAADIAMSIRRVHAAQGKIARAEPVAALYEAGRAHHAGVFLALEDELCGLIVGGGYEGPGRSPDRADALVWAMTELMLGERRQLARVRLV